MSHAFYKIIFTFVILLLIGGIVMAINATSHANTSNSESNKTIMQSYFLDMWNNKNTALIKKLVADNYTHHSSDGKITHGREHVENVVEKVYKAFPDIHWTIKLMVADNEMVATYIEGDGTQVSDGKKVHFKEAFYHRIEDGKIVEGWALPVK